MIGHNEIGYGEGIHQEEDWGLSTGFGEGISDEFDGFKQED